MIENYEDLFQKKKIIRFKVLLAYYHHHEETKLSAVAEEAKTTKSEITKCVNALLSEGILKRVNNRTNDLTSRGEQIAAEYHEKYQIAQVYLARHFDSETSSAYAEAMAMLFESEEIVKIFSIGVSAKKITEKFANHLKLDGKEFCKLLENASFTVAFTMDPVFNPMSSKSKRPTVTEIAKELAVFWHNRVKEKRDSDETKEGFVDESEIQDNLSEVSTSEDGRPENSPETENIQDEMQEDAEMCGGVDEKEKPFISFLEELVRKIHDIFFRKFLIFKNQNVPSMADVAFLHPEMCSIEEGQGHITLHRVYTNQTDLSGNCLSCKAESVKYYNGQEFIECPFNDDDVDIPLECFKFTRYGDCLIGKQLLQFTAACGTGKMPVSVAELVIAIYPI